MASIQIKGVLRDPMEVLATNVPIRVTTVVGVGETLMSAVSTFSTNSDGEYDFQLVYGSHRLEVRFDDRYVKLGDVTVNGDLVGPLEIGELLLLSVPVTPPVIEEMNRILNEAKTARDESQAAAVTSQQQANRAETEADRAETAADAAEYYLMSESQAMAQADTYEQFFAASGMVHNGKQVTNAANRSVVNDGLWSFIAATDPNKIFVGRGSNAQTGESKTDFPVTYIAGAIANIYGLDYTNPAQFQSGSFTLPVAESGTRVYDSTGDVRETGEATLDLRYDIDPKYGDVPSGSEAEILREAQGRAFEGQAKNGDFRLGQTIWGATYAGNTLSIADNVATITSGGSRYTGIQQLANWHETGIEYDFEITILSASTDGDLVMSFNNEASGNESFLASELPKTFRFTGILATGSAGNLRFYVDSGTSTEETYTFSNFIWEPSTEEVVTNRSDLVTWESYDEELTDRQEIFECIQSTTSTFGTTSVPTVLSTRPNSYFDQYDGQSSDPDGQNTVYRCVVWTDLTNEQKREIAAYMGNKLYMGENGNLVNRRLRARTFRGAGNGDWNNIDSVNPVNFLQAQGSLYAQAHGSLDTVAMGSSLSSNTISTFVGINSPLNSYEKSKGTFALRDTAGFGRAYKGRCFLYVVASVPRACKAGYVKGLNEFGTGMLLSTRGPGFSEFWWATNAVEVRTIQDTFTELAPNTGAIGEPSGHPDGIFYDGITAGGLNGVIDWRLPAFANDTPEEQSKAQSKVENKTFRGLEKLVKTKVFSGLTDVFDASQFTSRRLSLIAGDITQEAKAWVGENRGYDVPDDEGKLPVLGYLINDNTKDIYPIHNVNITSVTSEFRFNTTLEGYNAAYADNGIPWSLVLYTEMQTNLSVSGEFNTSMVIGDPANLVQVDALKDGWLGTWCPVIPDGTSKEIPLSRKNIGAVPSTVYTPDNGATWGAGSRGNFDFVKNSDTVGFGGTEVQIWNYTAYAKVTEPCENEPVYNGKKGLMSVFVTKHNNVDRGCLLAESLIGKVLTADGTYTPEVENLNLTCLGYAGHTGSLSENIYTRQPEHAALTLGASNNDSPAIKVLPYQIAENERCFIGYQANELTWGAGSFTDISMGNAINSNLNSLVRMVGGELSGWYKRTSNAFSSLTYQSQFDNGTLSKDKDGNVVGLTGGILYVLLEPVHPVGWGDDDKIKVTADGSDTFVDLNGNTNLSVSHKTTMPTGWTKNRARIGEQVEGVDL